MRIAYLGWGSLIWNIAGLPVNGAWMKGGPILPIEFSRVSSGGRLTLVIDNTAGVPIETFYALCAENDLVEAVEQLRRRESCPTKADIGYVDIKNGNDSLQEYHHQLPVHKSITDWGIDHNFDAVLWTALLPNFCKKTTMPFSVDNALLHLESLSASDRASAIEYIQNAPAEVQTPFRNKFDSLWRSLLQ